MAIKASRAVRMTGPIDKTHGLLSHVMDNLQSAKSFAFDNTKNASDFDSMVNVLRPVVEVENTFSAALIAIDRKLSDILNPPESHDYPAYR